MDNEYKASFQKHIYHEPNSGCWLWSGADNGNGYGKFRGKYAHRIAYEIANGPIQNNLHIDHLCRVPCCVNPDHMEPVSNKENARRGLAGHHMKNGRAPRQENHRMAVMTSDLVASLRSDCNAGMSQYAAAKKYGISQPTVSQIMRNVTWRNI